MIDFADSYLGRLRQIVGNRPLLMPGVRVVVERDDGAILLQHRSDFRIWGLPGGVPDEGEGLEAVAVRETIEETGLRPLAPKPFGFACDPAYEVWTYPNGHVCHYFTLLFFATAFEGELAADLEESLNVGWFAPTALPELMPQMSRTLEAYAAFRRDGTFQMI